MSWQDICCLLQGTNLRREYSQQTVRWTNDTDCQAADHRVLEQQTTAASSAAAAGMPLAARQVQHEMTVLLSHREPTAHKCTL
jgi:hypothetical protein